MKVNFLLCVIITIYILTTYKANNANNANNGFLGFLRRKHKGIKNTAKRGYRKKRVLRYQVCNFRFFCWFHKNKIALIISAGDQYCFNEKGFLMSLIALFGLAIL